MGRKVRTPREEHIYREQVKQLYALLPLGLVATLVNSFIVVLILWEVISHAILIVWLSSLYGVSLLRYMFLWRYRRIIDTSRQPEQWGRIFIAGMALSGVAWGSAGIFLFAEGSITYQVFLAFVLGGMVAGAASTYAALEEAFLAYCLPALVPLGMHFLAVGRDFHIAMGGMVALYGVLISITARNNHKVIETSLELRFENRDLIENLGRKVDERTVELRTANAQLECEVNERKMMEEALRRSERQYRDLFEGNPFPMLVYERNDLSILAANDAAIHQYGYPLEEFLKMTIKDLHPPEDIPRLIDTITNVQGEYRTPGVWRHLKKDGTFVDAEITTHEISFNGKAARLVLASDVTARRQAEEKVKYQAYHDLLTGLPNKMLFMEHLVTELAQMQRAGRRLAVFFLDLDQFKYINDSLGHSVGDRLLVDVAGRLKTRMREADTIARIGGDEFTILLPLIASAEDAAEIAKKIMSSFAKPFRIDGHELHVTASIGISIYPEDGEYAEALLKNADIAMFHAKERGRGNYQFYNPGINTRTLERILLENRLRQTLERGELVVYYQPQMNIKDREMICAEALVRWQHPELGLLGPMQFIPLAEETGLIMSIDEWVLRTVCARNVAWQKTGYPPMCITVNLSARQFQQENLAEMVEGVLRDTGMRPEFLGFEITETIAMMDTELTARTLGRLTGMGIKFAIDDFGTGYSSLSYLKKLPIQKLKIDKSFIRDIATDQDDRAIINAVIAMAHNLRLEVVAEGVETEDQFEFLRINGCDAIQGFLFSKPLPENGFRELRAALK